MTTAKNVTAFQPRPMSEILAPEAGSEAEALTDEKPAAEPEVKTDDPPAPTKYDGKSTEDVIEMHLNSEKRLGQIQNELGQMRGLVSDLSALQVKAPPPEAPVTEPVNVSGDDILSSPVESIEKVLQPKLDQMENERLEREESNLLRAEANALTTEFPQMNQIVETPEFQSFVNETASRKTDYELAASGGVGIGQVRAARRLMEDFKSIVNAAQPAAAPAEPSPTEIARSVATERGGTGAPADTKAQLHEADVIALINNDPAKYRSPSFQRELNLAIAEGRFVKNT